MPESDASVPDTPEIDIGLTPRQIVGGFILLAALILLLRRRRRSRPSGD
jgi:hypothetical protein